MTEGGRDAPSYALSSWLYVRLLGLVLLVAFLSLWVQMEGLLGEDGIAPAEALFAHLRGAEGVSFFDRPSLAWLAADETALGLICAAGVFASFLVLVGAVPKVSLFACWALYLSIVNAGFPFTAFQWDTLLLEATFLSIFVAPWAALDRPALAREPDPLRRWLVWFLLFRLMFRSGVVKLTSGDPTWADLTALEYHYETQPLPTWLGWYAHQLPTALQKLSTAVMFAIELVAPFLLFVPRRWARHTAAAAFVVLMLLISLTGNYGFFNLLGIVLSLALLDDALLLRMSPRAIRDRLRRTRDAEPDVPRTPPPPARRWPGRIVPAAVLALTAIVFVTGFSRSAAFASLGPFRTFNNYGLFAVMTTERPEIVIEGSRDGVTWEEYGFRYKPGALDRAPPFNQPHQPRLDWQMWFAALGSWQQNRWLVAFLRKLLENEPAVLELLAHNPFPDRPPRYVRAVLYDYRFTDWDARDETGHWWRRERVGLYAPVQARD